MDKNHNDIFALESDLKKAIQGDVRFDSFSKTLYSTDASIYQMEPVGVVLPRDTDDVLASMEIAKSAGIPIMPRGGGTSLAGQTVNHALVLDFSKYMNRVLEVNYDERWARVQPGIVLDDLNRNLLEEKRVRYGPDPSTSNRACIGGGIGNNSCGAHSLVYGKTSDQVLEIEAVLSNATKINFGPLSPGELEKKLSKQDFEGNIYREVLDIAQSNSTEIESNYPKISRRISGYNLDSLLGNSATNMADIVVGSEGTLCMVTEATVKLVKTPRYTGLCIVHFSDLAVACAATTPILEHDPSAVELIDSMLIERTRQSPAFSRLMKFIDGQPKAVLIVEFSGETPSEISKRLTSFKVDLQRQSLGYAWLNITDKIEQQKVWSIRKAGLGLLMSIRGNNKPIPFVEDTAVDPSRLGEFVRRFDSIVKSNKTTAGYYGHASVGCLHIRPLINLKTREGLETMFKIAEEVGDLVKEFCGSFSGEHGDGIVRGVWTKKMFGPKLYKAFQDVKRSFDPDNLMNPGKIIDTPPMIDNLRVGIRNAPLNVETFLDFSLDDGLAGAVEMCNGMGDCRKGSGTMCPSFQATREEEHSTRGRANLLRAVLSGGLTPKTITHKRLYDALDLCIECKGCKGECPSGVDMAKIKYEFLYQYNKINPPGLRTRLFANINMVSRWASIFPNLSNISVKLPGIRHIFESLLGIHRKRPLPTFSKINFPNWFKKHTPLSTGERGTVILFNDTFMNYNLPQIGIATTELLEKCGFNVVLANGRCCGRPMISKGLLEEARANARANVDSLIPYVLSGATIVGCEPSCLLTLTDEYPDLLQDANSRLIAKNSVLIDQFILDLNDSGNFPLTFSDMHKQIQFHGHCHQKASSGVESSIRALSLPKNFTVELIDAGCCGMAGSFGFEKEHYDISMAIGNDRLFPSIIKKDQDWEIAVMGISCRQQIEHGTLRQPRHLVEILRDAIV
ncbi:MAG: oxidoreductase [Dehalococcoidia bacterium]|nr:oxidoreductase [Dehalococcoidia bacterium]